LKHLLFIGSTAQHVVFNNLASSEFPPASVGERQPTLALLSVLSVPVLLFLVCAFSTYVYATYITVLTIPDIKIAMKL